jgi:dihydrolipoamide dehydrogenase
MHDLLVIGGGPGGYVAAIRAAQHGLKVLLIEKDVLGGTCLNRGCIPTKSYIHDTKLLKAAQSSPVLQGTEGLALDPGKMVARKRQVVKGLVTGLEAILRSNRIDVVAGRGEFLAPGRVRAVKTDGSAAEYQAKHIILATGSRPAIPPFLEVDGRLVQTTDEALDTEEIPRSIIIIGGGVIGTEMAAIYLNLGCQVTILELLPDILTTEDEDVRRTLKKLLQARGATLHLKVTAKEVAGRGDAVEVTWQDQDGHLGTATADRLLVAAGRAPLLTGLDPGKTGLATAGRFIKVNSNCATSLPGVYAIGDLVGGVMLAHKASAEAEIAVASILGQPKALRPELIPRCIWGITEIGAVGLTEAEARASGRLIKVGKFPFMNSGAARARGNPDGFTKIIGDAETGEILGVHILGEHATELIGEAVTAMTMEAVVEDLAEAVKPHPTLGETLMEAALGWSGRAIHSLAT